RTVGPGLARHSPAAVQPRGPGQATARALELRPRRVAETRARRRGAGRRDHPQPTSHRRHDSGPAWFRAPVSADRLVAHRGQETGGRNDRPRDPGDVRATKAARKHLGAKPPTLAPEVTCPWRCLPSPPGPPPALP